MTDKNIEIKSSLKNKLNGLPIQKYLVWVGFFVIFMLVFILNYFFPIYADDMTYSVVRFGESLNLVENLKEIKDFIIYYYFNWGGRVVAHFFAKILLLFDAIWQDIFNSIIFCFLIYLVYKISLGKGNKNNIFLLFFLIGFIFYYTPSFISSAVWMTGSANYLWMITLTLSFVYLYISNYECKSRMKEMKSRIVLIFFWGIISAWTNENVGPVLFLIIVSYSFLYFKRDKYLPKWAIAGILGVIIGCLLLILAPGNAVRAEAEGFPSLFSSFDEIVNKRIFTVIAVYKTYLLKTLIPYIIVLLFFYFYSKKGIDKKYIFIKSLIIFLAANISSCLIAFSPTFPPRALMGMVVLFILSAAILYANIDFKKLLPKIVNYIFLAFLLYGSTLLYVQYFRGANFLHNYMIEREEAIADAKEQGKKEVAVVAIHLDDRFEYTDFKNFYRDYYDIEVLFLELGDSRLNIDNDETN